MNASGVKQNYNALEKVSSICVPGIPLQEYPKAIIMAARASWLLSWLCEQSFLTWIYEPECNGRLHLIYEGIISVSSDYFSDYYLVIYLVMSEGLF